MMMELMAEQDLGRQWAQTCKKYAPELEERRLQDVRDADSFLSLQRLARAFNQATRGQPVRVCSGLVEMQHDFARLRQG